MANGLGMSAGPDQRTCRCNFMPHMNVEQPLINYEMPDVSEREGRDGGNPHGSLPPY
jgi:hypothetical protein